MFEQAFNQAEIYKQTVFPLTELAGYRYLVAVSEKELPRTSIPGERETPQGVVYRHVNIVVEPEHPSKVAAKRAARKPT
jgi:hypothetical protein